MSVSASADPACGLEGEHDVAERIPLELPVRPVAGPYRARAEVPGQRVDDPLLEPALAGQPVHDLHVGRIARDRAQQPPPPALRLGPEPVVQQHVQRERRVPQPDVAVVPVALAAELLRQARGRCRDDAAGVLVGEGTQHEQRALHRLRMHRRCGRGFRPVAPPAIRALELAAHRQGFGRLPVRGVPGHHMLVLVALAHDELGAVAVSVRLQLDPAHDDGIRPGDGDQHLLRRPRRPCAPTAARRRSRTGSAARPAAPPRPPPRGCGGPGRPCDRRPACNR